MGNIIDGIQKDQPVIIVGYGAGYHIAALAKELPEQEICALEFNLQYANWFKKSLFYESVAVLPHVKMKTTDHLSAKERASIFSDVHQNNLLIQKTSMDIMPAKYNNVKLMLKDFQMQKDSIKNQIGTMIENFQKNIALNDSGIGELKDIYKGKKMILVSAGPSLDKQLPLLKKIREEGDIVIGAVGTAVRPLYRCGIIPNFLMIIDPQEGTMKQLTGIKLPNTPLYYMSTAYHDTVKLHAGPRRIVWQNGFMDAHKMAIMQNDPLIQTGGSVATALLDTMVFLGGQVIALIGQDLAFTGGKSHASHTAAEKEVEETANTIKVQNYYQTGEVITANNLSIYRKWFERYAENNAELSLYNCTEGGAYINGWKHSSLNDFHLLDIF
ncbi:hypothetical protein BTO28_15585 [Domibacillus epiphyticus]|uniref:6-hydroxymethylpterin diphosphokinase MptE-like domain-containing protein n=1 Tax=Domibacillus epiphyticus TaxID=1714355 RepID=A0A1V2A471_9BACI|nr:hypothetical protein BTO28_15585 [Domibacillus epiphyticus]